MSLAIAGTITAGLAVAGATVYAANAQADAAQKASQTQASAAQAGIDVQKSQFDAIQKLLAPYVEAGAGALASQQDLAGINGPEAQQRAIEAIQKSPEFTALSQQGENAILQNASATGGLRGGNVQGALANQRTNLLSSLVNNQFARLGGITQLGQNSAVGQANFGQMNAQQIADLLAQQGAAKAGGELAVGQQAQGWANAAGGLAGTLGGLF